MLTKSLWKCPNCKREFKNKNQVHSCRAFPLENHFENKKLAKDLFDYLVSQIEKKVGPLKIESPECCIHLVSTYTFGAVWPLKDKIRIDFRTNFEISSKRIWRMIKMSKNRNLYFFEISNKKEVDRELLGWMSQAYHLND